MPSMTSFVSLASIVANNSILQVVFVKFRVEEGQSLKQGECT
jgi:multidrug efflux pump subunit AcrB